MVECLTLADSLTDVVENCKLRFFVVTLPPSSRGEIPIAERKKENLVFVPIKCLPSFNNDENRLFRPISKRINHLNVWFVPTLRGKHVSVSSHNPRPRAANLPFRSETLLFVYIFRETGAMRSFQYKRKSRMAGF